MQSGGGATMEDTAAAAKGGGEGGVEVDVEEGPRFRRVCVFCGSSSGKRSSYRDAAVELGKELVSRVHAYYCYWILLHELICWFVS
jgi:hypothetical protein